MITVQIKCPVCGQPVRQEPIGQNLFTNPLPEVCGDCRASGVVVPETPDPKSRYRKRGERKQ